MDTGVTRAGRQTIILALGSLLLVTGCGSRLSDDRIAADWAGSAETSTDGSVTGGGSGTGTTGSGTSPTGGGGAMSGTGSGSVAGQPTGAGATSATTGTGGAGTGGQATGGSGSSGTTGAGPRGNGLPILVGTVGPYTGIQGQVLAPMRRTVLAWAASVNARGGINGHPVRVFTADDANDGQRGYSFVQDMVENKKVIAFVGAALTYTGRTSKSYLERKRVPAIGGDVLDAFWHESPMYFPQVAFIDNSQYVTMASLKSRGVTRAALLYCAEVPACDAAVVKQEQAARKLGMTITYKGRISIASPDYTSDCLQAQSANGGAQGIYVSADASTTLRVVDDCARQNYFPIMGLQGFSIGTAYLKSKNMNGAIGPVQAFPFFRTSGGKPYAEYGAAMSRYARGQELTPPTASAWASAKLFEKVAAATIGPNDAPSSAKVLDGLWALRNEMLGGLTSPLTFVKDKPARKGQCFFIVAIRDGRWVSPQGDRLSCGSV